MSSDIVWRASPHFNRIPSRRVRAIVIHTAECNEGPRSDEGVAAWFANPASKVSAHYVVDADSVTACVHEGHVAWHAGPVNDWTVGIELCGRASQTAEQWADEYSLEELERAAQLVAKLCARHEIPPCRTPVEAIKARGEGIYGHADVTAAYGHSGGHWDPGPAFPWEWFIERVRECMRRDTNVGP